MELYLNLNAVNQEAAKTSASKGSGRIIKRKDIPEGDGMEVRLVPSGKSMGGNYYLKEISIWINKKNYVSPRTFGLPCPILDLYDAIQSGGDEDLKALADAKSFSVKEEFLIPAFQMDTTYENGVAVSSTIVGDSVKILQATWGMIMKINAILNMKVYQNGSPLVILDPEKGRNLTLTRKTGGQYTEYGVLASPHVTPIDEKYYENVPDLVAETKKRIFSDEYLESVAENYFVGSPIMDYEDRFKGKTKEIEKNPTSLLDKVKG